MNCPSHPCQLLTTLVAADVPSSGLYMLTTSNNAESMCTAQGALLASYLPGDSPKAFYQSDYATCTLAARGSCADYNTQLLADLPACSAEIAASSYAIASYYAAGAQPLALTEQCIQDLNILYPAQGV